MSSSKPPYKFTFERVKVTRYSTFENRDAESKVTVAVYADSERQAQRLALELSEGLEHENEYWSFKLVSVEPSE